MTIGLTTPAILFPAITLLMLAYTNRFLALSQLIRSLHHDYSKSSSKSTLKQIKHLLYRVFFIQLMQAFGALSILFCVLSIFSLLLTNQYWGSMYFVVSLAFFLCSIICSFIEISMSSKALNILLADLTNQN